MCWTPSLFVPLKGNEHDISMVYARRRVEAELDIRHYKFPTVIVLLC